MSSRTLFARNLASAFLAGAWSLAALTHRGTEACGERPRWLRPLVRRVMARWPASGRLPEVEALTSFLLDDAAFCEGWSKQPRPLRRVFCVTPSMSPAPATLSGDSLPVLASPGALADWLGITPGDLDWFADVQHRERRTATGPLRHYTYRWRIGRRKARLLEVPKSRLKEIQHRLLRGLLDSFAPHEAAHAYRRGRSVATLVAPHAGRDIVIHLDLRDFFPSVPASRVHALFRTAGYPRPVARLLTGLCTNSVPADVLDPCPIPLAGRLSTAHLPQGAPTSPALANLCAFRLDCRLAGLARSLGAAYTRYADDLVFSGGQLLERAARRFHVHVCRIALEEGFEVNTRKSHFMRQGVRQQVAGIVLNARPNVRRPDYDLLKAILTNCIRRGPDGQNRAAHPDFRAHLLGRIAHVGLLHPERGRRLRLLFEKIRWEKAPGPS